MSTPSDNSVDDTPISSFFRHPTGILLTDLDKARFDKEIPLLEHQVRYFDEQSALLVSRRDQVTLSLAMRRSALAPVWHLPPDVLREIFSQVAADHDSIDLSGGPWTLGQVCAPWRDLVLDTPLVWSRPTLKGVYTSQSLHVLAEYLRRSRDCPLHIRAMFFVHHPQSAILDLHEAVFKVLITSSSRWKFVCFVIPMEFLKHISALCGKMPLLEEARIHLCTYYRHNPDGVEWRHLFSNVPSLRKISLDGPLFSEHMLTGNHITHFAGYVDRPGALRTIFKFPALVECHLWYRGSGTGSLQSPIRHDRIKYLAVNTTRVLAVLTLPSLKHLEIDEQYERNECVCAEAMSAFMDRSSFHLRSLSMTCRSFRTQLIQPYYMQMVEDFAITIHTSATLVAMFSPTRCDLFPKLRRLHIRLSSKVYLSKDHVLLLVNFIRERLDEAKSVALDVEKLDKVQISSSVPSYLDEFRKCGFDEFEIGVLTVDPQLHYLELRNPPWFDHAIVAD
ncbi:uncharacterized protein BT62DRAFT_1080983 [Guyanagaster necrorhizus]|uniref:F-box domain-containing protein n=1 Tax=Guyanagaster necrorhizus TaxID=856835 RepID=A0A9P8ALI4_9AGAR|nr:uncharacterized protein BT62DRAFT_1080983 [Guyanagaster necrorhizus MCA 3950]KAG7440238.1 hypothetical protein BT62DRAFT_1080983 [Guyanagaster necrorhizus MCA 3950]